MLTLHYRRPPDRVQVLQQQIVYRDETVLVSFLASAAVAEPVLVNGALMVEPGSPLIWFTFAGARHDVGRFYSKTGEFTGLYSDILETVSLPADNEMELTDLFLDVWIAAGRKPVLLDEDELAAAQAQGWISAGQAAAARAEAEQVVAAYEQGSWPPSIVNEWTLERVTQLTSKRQ
jgi:predicted RNA-binding protein associated with RNAse of E/G family